MTTPRMQGVDARTAGPFVKALLALSARMVRKLTGNQPQGALGPAEAYAHLPGLMIGIGAVEGATARQHRVPERLKLLAEMKAATMTSCEYCLDIGSQIARRGGISDEELLAIGRYRDSDLFDDLDKLVMEYAAGMSRQPVDVSDELYARMRARFDEPQIVELTHLIALENMRGRFNLALGYHAVGFSEGRVCALPEGPAEAGASPDGRARVVATA